MWLSLPESKKLSGTKVFKLVSALDLVDFALMYLIETRYMLQCSDEILCISSSTIKVLFLLVKSVSGEILSRELLLTVAWVFGNYFVLV